MDEVVNALWDELTILGIAAEPLNTSRTLELAEAAKTETAERTNRYA
jgi:hypothetical protein